VPVDDRELQARLREILDVNFADDELAWELMADGSWRKVPNRHGVNTHRELQHYAHDRARPTEARAI
jgi:polyphosphate kinase